MGYWFQDPGLKALLPLALANSIKGMTTLFKTPALIMGFNVFPEGMVIGPAVADFIGAHCPKKRAFVVADAFSERFAATTAGYFKANGFATQIWAKALPEAPLENVRECGAAMTAFEPDVIIAVGGGSVIDGAKAAWILYERPDITDLGTQVSRWPFSGCEKRPFSLLSRRPAAPVPNAPPSRSFTTPPRTGKFRSPMRTSFPMWPSSFPNSPSPCRRS